MKNDLIFKFTILSSKQGLACLQVVDVVVAVKHASDAPLEECGVGQGWVTKTTGWGAGRVRKTTYPKTSLFSEAAHFLSSFWLDFTLELLTNTVRDRNKAVNHLSMQL